jgi:Uracil DNA glycosylase superfamily
LRDYGKHGLLSRPMLRSHSRGLPDVISTSLDIVFCGINPGMQSAAVGLHFATRSNRFWRVLHLAGFTARQLEPEEACLLLDYGCGITSVVARPTVSATDLSRADYIAARPVFERKIAKYRPRYLAFLGEASAFSVSEPARHFVGITANDTRRICGLGITQSKRPEPRIHHRHADRRLSRAFPGSCAPCAPDGTEIVEANCLSCEWPLGSRRLNA